MSTEQIIDLVKYLFTITSVVLGVVVMFMNYNKRKIEEAKENSVGRAQVEEMKKRIDQQEKDQQEFRKDVYEMIFHKRIIA